MAKNLIPEIAKMLGVELGEEFKINKDNTGTLDSISLNSVYAFVEHDSFEGLVLTVSTGEYRPLYMPPRPLEPIALKVFELLCRGKCEVVKLPWKPKFADMYFGFFEFNEKLRICRYDIWRGTIAEEAQYRCGWVFRTREEAEAALPDVAKELGVEYEL